MDITSHTLLIDVLTLFFSNLCESNQHAALITLREGNSAWANPALDDLSRIWALVVEERLYIKVADNKL